MNTNKHEKEKLITLKEAAKISGYAPDYIGQLIRKGKLPGKQVYCTVAWMTTEEALRQYIERNKNEGRKLTLLERVTATLRQLKAKIMLEMKLARLFKTVLYLAIIFSIGFSLLLFYIFSVSLDKKLQENARKNLETQIIK